MNRGQNVLFVPSDVSVRGVKKLEQELRRAGVKHLAKNDWLVLAKWDDTTRKAVDKGLSIKTFYTDKIGSDDLKALPKTAARVAEGWNWAINRAGKRITDVEIQRRNEMLQLEMRNGVVYDQLTKKVLGNVRQKTQEKLIGNFYLYSQWGWEVWPAGWGLWADVKVWCRTRAYTNSSRTTRQVVGVITAEIDASQHYEYTRREDASSAYADDWCEMAWWTADGYDFTHVSYGRSNSHSHTISGVMEINF